MNEQDPDRMSKEHDTWTSQYKEHALSVAGGCCLCMYDQELHACKDQRQMVDTRSSNVQQTNRHELLPNVQFNLSCFDPAQRE